MSDRRIALFDIDKTIIDGTLIFKLAEYQCQLGLIPQSTVDILNEDRRKHHAHEIDYETVSVHVVTHWAEGLKGLSYQDILQRTKDYLIINQHLFFSFVKPVLSLLKPTHDIFFVSNENQFVCRAVTEYLGANGYASSELEIHGGLFTGNVTRTLAHRSEKHSAIIHLLQNHDLAKSFAFGDAEGDIDMLSRVEYPICINPSIGLYEVAIKNKWIICKPEDVLRAVSEIFDTI